MNNEIPAILIFSTNKSLSDTSIPIYQSYMLMMSLTAI